MRRIRSAALLLVFAGNAQQPARPEFEVATVKPAAMDPSQVGQLAMAGRIRVGPQLHGSTAEYLFMTLRQLVSEAYRVPPTQIVCPAWFMEDRFDVLARMPAGARVEDAPVMLQSLLEQRFKLAAHRESRDEAVVGLIAAPGGAKLTPSSPASRSTPADPADDRGKTAPSRTSPDSFGGMMGSVAVRYTINQAASTVRLDASGVPMRELARLLTNFGAGNNRPVVDLTELTGEYDIAFDIPLSTFASGRAEAEAAPRSAEYASDPGGGTIRRSLRTYGLDLKSMKAPLEFLVVDRAERKPAAN